MDLSKNIKILMKQTSYTEKESEEVLKRNNNDLFKCLLEYSGVKKEINKQCVTSNQERYRVIRGILDNKMD